MVQAVTHELLDRVDPDLGSLLQQVRHDLSWWKKGLLLVEKRRLPTFWHRRA